MNKITNNLLCIVTVIIVTPFVFICFFTHPSTDDLCYTYRSLSGFWDTQVYYYNEWSGRYFATALSSIYPYITDVLKGYGFAILFFFISFFLALLVLFKSLAGNLVSNRKLLWGTLIFLAIYLTRMESTSEGFYWFSGVVSYSYGNALLLILLSFLILDKRSKYKKNYQKIAYVLSCITLIFAVAGTNELNAVLLVVGIFGVIFIPSYSRQPSKSLWRICLGATTIAVATAILAPGNFVRVDHYVDNKFVNRDNLEVVWNYSLVHSFTNYGKYLTSWVLDSGLLSASLLFMIWSIYLLQNNTHFSQKYHKIKIPKISAILIYIVIWLLLILFIFSFPHFFGGYLPDRIINLAYLVFLLGWFIAVFILSVFLKDKIASIDLNQFNFIITSAQIVLMMGLLLQGNFLQAVSDLFLNAPTYDAELKTRYELISQNINEKSVRVPPLSKKP